MGANVGMIGAGRISRAHMRALEKIAGVRIVALCDVVRETAEAAAKEAGARPYADCREMLDSERLDAAWICTPASAHTGNVLECVGRGIPFFLEKPVALDADEAETVAAQIAAARIYHGVGYMLRYGPAAGKLREILSAETVVFPTAEYFWTIPPVDSIKSKETAGGQIVDQATHLIDLMRYTVGEISSVYTGRSRGFFPEESLYTGDDASATVFGFDSGIAGSLICTYALFPSIAEHAPAKMRVVCKRKLVEYAGQRVTVLAPDGEERYEYRADPMLLEDEAFLRGLAARDMSAVRSPYRDALETLKVCLAANRSMESGRKVLVR